MNTLCISGMGLPMGGGGMAILVFCYCFLFFSFIRRLSWPWIPVFPLLPVEDIELQGRLLLPGN